MKSLPGQPIDAYSVRYIVVNRHRKRIRPLKNHTNTAAEIDDIRAIRGDILAVELDRTFQASARDRVAHSIQGTQKSRLAATGRSDQRGNESLPDLHRDVV